jgi:hypothetical protein
MQTDSHPFSFFCPSSIIVLDDRSFPAMPFFPPVPVDDTFQQKKLANGKIDVFDGPPV